MNCKECGSPLIGEYYGWVYLPQKFHKICFKRTYPNISEKETTNYRHLVSDYNRLVAVGLIDNG